MTSNIVYHSFRIGNICYPALPLIVSAQRGLGGLTVRTEAESEESSMKLINQRN